MNTGNSQIQSVTQSLQRVIESLVELGVISSDPSTNDPSGDIIQRKIKGFIEDTQVVVKEADNLSDVQIPLDILQYIDNGRNPDVYSREFVELVIKQNQSVSGTADALKSFQNILSAEIASQFPELHEEVQKISNL
ncbi:mediator complex subunit [Starmerella bacillaris]|uniref:Mediator of RNA polymerase II transcription subunit 10 n=1 Tax=Starmerella bacillaris TaxID=1247836 RepID=A0AAV5RL70_STABA|nr:mediator complex subunit [Starmerella bacillaris]